MMFVKTDSTSANFHFALEEYLLNFCDVSDAYFLFWRTTPTLMIGKFQNTVAEINQTFVKQHAINVVRRITGRRNDLYGYERMAVFLYHQKACA